MACSSTPDFLLLLFQLEKCIHGMSLQCHVAAHVSIIFFKSNFILEGSLQLAQTHNGHCCCAEFLPVSTGKC